MTAAEHLARAEELLAESYREPLLATADRLRGRSLAHAVLALAKLVQGEKP